MLAGDLAPGKITVNSIVPEDDAVQKVNTYTFNFETEHTLYKEVCGIIIEMPPKIILPADGTTVTVTPMGDTAAYFVANKGTISEGKFITIDNVFGDSNPPPGPLTMEIKIEGIKNPRSATPAGIVSISTTFEGDTVDAGKSEMLFTPSTGVITGQPIAVTSPDTNGITSKYDLVIVPQSVIPVGGIIEIKVPPTIGMRTEDLTSGGSCTDPKLACLEADPDTNVIRIKTQEEIPLNMPYTFTLVGLDNPRSLKPT